MTTAASESVVSTRAQHTPGPWTFSVGEGGDNLSIRAGDTAVVAGCGCCGSPWTDHKRAGANARLIAAAPDMLAALKGIMADTCDLEPAYCADLVPETRDLIRAAIAKATGARVTDDPLTGTAST